MYPNSNRRGRRNLFLATILVVALFALDRATGGLLAAPVRDVGSAISRGAGSIFNDTFGGAFFATRAQLLAENKTLKDDIAALQERLAAAQVSESENQKLRELVHLATTTRGITAHVTSSFTTSPYGTFLIGAGGAQGVTTGSRVLSLQGFIIGTVTDVKETQSLVTEIFAAGSSVDVLAGDVPITLQGEGGGNAVGMAPRGSTFATGTPVIAPALGGRPVGFVGRAEGDAGSASVKTYVRSPINLATLDLVYVEAR